MRTAATTSVPAPVKTRPVSLVTGWTSAGRAGAAITLVASGLLWFVAEVIGFGHDHMTYLASHRTLGGIGVTADILAVPFLFGSVAVWLLMARRASPKLAWIGTDTRTDWPGADKTAPVPVRAGTYGRGGP